MCSTCEREGARRSLAIEVKLLRTDGARQQLIDSVRLECSCAKRGGVLACPALASALLICSCAPSLVYPAQTGNKLPSCPCPARPRPSRSAYRQRCEQRLKSDALALRHRCHWLGWAGVISFPHLFAASFGEYGTPEVSRLGRKHWKRVPSWLCSACVPACWDQRPLLLEHITGTWCMQPPGACSVAAGRASQRGWQASWVCGFCTVSLPVHDFRLPLSASPSHPLSAVLAAVAALGG